MYKIKGYLYHMMRHEVARKYVELAIKEYGLAHRLDDLSLQDFYEQTCASPIHYPELFQATRTGKPSCEFHFLNESVSKVVFLSLQQSYLAQLEYELKNHNIDTSLSHYAQEYCTIKFQLPRRSGKTTALINVGKLCFKNVAFVTHNLKEVKRIEHLWNIADGNCCAKFFSRNQVLQNDLGGVKDLDAILVDNAFMLKESDDLIDKMSMCFCGGSNRPFFIVMMD